MTMQKMVTLFVTILTAVTMTGCSTLLDSGIFSGGVVEPTHKQMIVVESKRLPNNPVFPKVGETGVARDSNNYALNGESFKNSGLCIAICGKYEVELFGQFSLNTYTLDGNEYCNQAALNELANKNDKYWQCKGYLVDGKSFDDVKTYIKGVTGD